MPYSHIRSTSQALPGPLRPEVDHTSFAVLVDGRTLVRCAKKHVIEIDQYMNPPSQTNKKKQEDLPPNPKLLQIHSFRPNLLHLLPLLRFALPLCHPLLLEENISRVENFAVPPSTGPEWPRKLCSEFAEADAPFFSSVCI